MAVQSTNIPVLPEPVDFTAADFGTCEVALQGAVQQSFPTWTDFNRAAPANVMLRGFCFVLDIQTKYQNDQARECFFSTVQRRRNMLAHSRGFGIPLKGIGAASADLKFTLAAAGAFSVVIPAGTLITTSGIEEPIEFFTETALTILAGATEGTVSGINSESRFELLDSDGSANQIFGLSFRPFVDGTLEITVGTETYVEVLNFFNSGPTSPHFQVFVDEGDRAFVVFGNGVSGKVPPAGDIDVVYDTGGGSAGNVAIGRITRLSQSIVDTGGNAVPISVTNEAAATGGAERESVEQARRRLPGALRALTRSVSKEDFEINSLGVAGIARTMFLTTDEDGAIDDNSGEIIIIPTSGGLPSSSLKALAVAAVTVTFPTAPTFLVVAIDPTFNTIAVTSDVKVKNGFTTVQVEANINAALTALFALEVEDSAGSLIPNSQIDFGANRLDSLMPFSDIFNAVRDAAGVERVDPATFLPAADVSLAFRDFPVLGTVTVGFL